MDIGLILVTVCGLSLVCLGTFAVVAFIVVRTTGVRLWDAFGGIGAIFGAISAGEDGEPETTARRARRSRPDLRARAEALDFDSAVARHSSENTPPAAAQSAAPRPLADPATPPETRSLTQSPFGSSRRRQRTNEDEDEIFGGLLDEDGDGSIDF